MNKERGTLGKKYVKRDSQSLTEWTVRERVTTEVISMENEVSELTKVTLYTRQGKTVTVDETEINKTFEEIFN